MITIKNLHKSYGSLNVLRNINAQFANRQAYGIVGKNGSGKTTLFNCIIGLLGYNGEIVSADNPLKNYIGYLPADPFFMDYITGYEYLSLLCHARDITPFNFDEKNIFNLPLHQYASTYSTGMKKKLALLALILQNNTYYILDEPFNGLDIESSFVVQEILKQLLLKNKTIILSSHIFGLMSTICSQIYLLQEGTLLPPINKDNFGELEKQMQDIFIGDKVKNLLDNL